MNSKIPIDPEESEGVEKVESAMLTLQWFLVEEGLKDATNLAFPPFKEEKKAVF